MHPSTYIRKCKVIVQLQLNHNIINLILNKMRQLCANSIQTYYNNKNYYRNNPRRSARIIKKLNNN